MDRKHYDPLAFVPPPDAVRAKLEETLTLAKRLRLLLAFAERVRSEFPSTARRAPHESEVARVR